MTKLLTEPRITKQTEPKKRVKRIKKEIDGEKPSVKYTLIKESNKDVVNELFRIYKENPFYARVKYLNNTNKNYLFTRLVLFEYENGDFEFCEFMVKFGISISNRIYSSQKKTCAISYKNGKFWCLNRLSPKSQLSVRPLLYGGLINFIRETENMYDFFNLNDNDNSLSKSFTFKYLKERFFWIKTLSESSVSMGVNLNNVKSKKIYGLNDINRHIFGVPNNIAKMVMDSRLMEDLKRHGGVRKNWLKIYKVLENVQNLKPELLNCKVFYDTFVMANTLGRKINCNWGEKRLIQEHDSWSSEIGNIVLDCEKEYELKIKPIYKKFAEHTGLKLLTTNKDLLLEGFKQKHCVGTYIDRVDRGDCAIFNVNGFTLQLKVSDIKWSIIDAELERNKDITKITEYSQNSVNNFDVDFLSKIDREFNKTLTIAQFKGKFNVEAPNALKDMVNTKIIEFINWGGYQKSFTSNEITEDIF